MNVQTTTQNRKVLAQHLSNLIGEPVKYLGAPTMAYQVGPYTINRDGSISGDDFEAIRGFLVENDYIHETIGTAPEAEQTAEADSEADPVVMIVEALEEVNSIDTITESDGVTHTCVSIPLADYTPLAVACLLKTMYARQKLIAAMTQSDCIQIDEELIGRLNEEKPETIEQIQKILSDEISIGMVKGICIEDGKFKMTFPFDQSRPTEWQAYAEIMLAAAKRAKTARFVGAKLIAPAADEMKYFCRNWLIQLGLGGADHKETRRVLLDHLTGFAAFRTSDKMQAHKDRYAAKRREKREAKAIQESEVTSDD